MNYNINIYMCKMLKYITDSPVESIYKHFSCAVEFFEHNLLKRTNKNDESDIMATGDYITQNLRDVIIELCNKINKLVSDIFYIVICSKTKQH